MFELTIAYKAWAGRVTTAYLRKENPAAEFNQHELVQQQRKSPVANRNGITIL